MVIEILKKLVSADNQVKSHDDCKRKYQCVEVRMKFKNYTEHSKTLMSS